MQRHEYPAGFPVRLALKDLKLVKEVAEGLGVELPVLDAGLRGLAPLPVAVVGRALISDRRSLPAR